MCLWDGIGSDALRRMRTCWSRLRNSHEAIRRGELAIYDQNKKQYIITDIDEPAEVTCLIGNVSIKEGEVFCHLHATLVRRGEVVGGHVCEGCSVFALEFMIQEMQGEALLRLPDKETGLALWNL